MVFLSRVRACFTVTSFLARDERALVSAWSYSFTNISVIVTAHCWVQEQIPPLSGFGVSAGRKLDQQHWQERKVPHQCHSHGETCKQAELNTGNKIRKGQLGEAKDNNNRSK